MTGIGLRRRLRRLSVISLERLDQRRRLKTSAGSPHCNLVGGDPSGPTAEVIALARSSVANADELCAYLAAQHR